MSGLRAQLTTMLQALAAMLLFVTVGAAQIAGLCNTGQTSATVSGCTGVLVGPPTQLEPRCWTATGN